MPDNKKSLEVLTSSLDLNQEKLADNEKNERVQEIVDTQNNKDIDNKINEIETASDTLVTNEQMKKELWAHKVEAEMSAREKIKEKWGETAERAKRNWWLIVWWVGSFLGIRRLWKKIKWNETTETSNSTNSTETKDSKGNTVINVDATPKKNWFQRNWGWLVWGAWVAGAWYFLRDKVYKLPWIWPQLDKLFNKRMTMEQAIPYVEGNILNKAAETHLKWNPKLNWNSASKKLSVFDQEFEIDTDNKKIKWLDIQFNKFEDLITTAWIIWSAKYNFQWACLNDSPFSITQRWWDIEVALNKDANKDLVSWKSPIPVGTITGGVLGATLGWVAGAYLWKNITTTVWWAAAGGLWWAALGNVIDNSDTLSKVCPVLNEWDNRDYLVSYLNSTKWWVQWNDENLEQKAKTDNEKVNKTFIDTLHKIENTIDKNDDKRSQRGKERSASISNYNNQPNIIELKSRWSSFYFHTILDTVGNIVSIEPEDTGIVFNGPNAVSEAIHFWLFINQSEKELAWRWDTAEPFEYRDGITVSTLNKEWIYFDESWSVFDYKLSKDAMQKNIPTLLQWNNMQKTISWLNSRQSTNGMSLWKKNEANWSRNNTYLKSLWSKNKTINSEQKKTA